MDYARLLSDPCNGPLVSGPFADGRNGIVTRFERDFIINSSATDIAAAIAFIPATGTYYLSNAAITSDTGAITWTAAVIATFLSTNCAQARCLSSCMQIMWPGTESNRQGVISLTNTPSDDAFGAPTVQSLRQQAQTTCRMPNEVCEIKWVPTTADLEWQNLKSAPSSITDVGRFSCLAGTASGIPVSTGVRVRIVAVYEWLPAVGLGLTVPSALPISASRNTFRDVLEFLGQTAPDWYLKYGAGLGGPIAGAAVRAVSYAAKAAKTMVFG